MEPIRVPFSPFVDLDGFRSCFLRSRLEPESRFLLSVEGGTTRETLGRWAISVCRQSADRCEPIELPSGQY